jgi:hypothetical protein
MDPNLRDIFYDPARRRFWLLTKALESAPLRDALTLAKGAEAFLTGRGDASPEGAVADHSTVLQLSTLTH